MHLLSFLDLSLPQLHDRQYFFSYITCAYTLYVSIQIQGTFLAILDLQQSDDTSFGTGDNGIEFENCCFFHLQV